MDKSKKVSLGVRKSKRKNKKMIRKVVDYLKFDCYMFAPLFPAALQPSDSGAAKTNFASATGPRVRELSKRKKKRLLEEVRDFLKSDYHMYGSIVPRLNYSPLKGELQYTHRVSLEVSTSTIIMEDEQQTLRSPNVIRKGHYSKSSHSEISTSRQQVLGQDETVKHTFHKKSRSSSVPEEGKLKTKPRRVAID